MRKDEAFRLHELERRVRVRLPGFEAWIVNKEDLILSKLVWAKPSMSDFQLRDVHALLTTGADLPYLRDWAARLGIADLLQSCLDARYDT